MSDTYDPEYLARLREKQLKARDPSKKQREIQRQVTKNIARVKELL